MGTSGVARFFGVANFSVCLGILKRVDDDVAADERETVTLGLCSTKYSYTGDTTKVTAFLREARDAAVAPPQACASTPGVNEAAHGRYADQVRDALRKIGQKTETLLTKSKSKKLGNTSGYYLDFLVRKFYLASLAVCKTSCDSTCSLARLREYSADAKEHLKELPGDWTAAEASEYVCHRSDWSVFASMYMCLWKEVADAAEADDDGTPVLRWVLKNKAKLVAAASSFRTAHGLNPHPWILMREAGWTPPSHKRKA